MVEATGGATGASRPQDSSESPAVMETYKTELPREPSLRTIELPNSLPMPGAPPGLTENVRALILMAAPRKT